MSGNRVHEGWLAAGSAREPADLSRARWKHLCGEGREAIYRATCGRAGCPGHLGDLGFDRSDDWAEVAALLSADDVNPELLQTAKEAWTPEWSMSAEPQHVSRMATVAARTGFDAIYRGFGDTGYRISHGGKRSRHGERVGRRPDPIPLPLSALRKLEQSLELHPYFVSGQTVRPTDRVWCPSCGTLNRLDWPEPLQDPRAR